MTLPNGTTDRHKHRTRNALLHQ